MKTLTLFFLLITVSVTAQTPICNVLDYGAKPDGKTLSTEAIQKAVEKCADKGGGTVVFPAGTYLTGTIILKENVILHLQPGSKILGSKNIDDYRVNLKLNSNNKKADVYKALILGINKNNIGITGSGTIDGNGQSFYGKENRPLILYFYNCKDVTINGITLQHPASWTQHYLKCEGVTIRDIKVFAHGSENNDMVDINQTRNVVITGLNGDSDDDGITLKSTGDGMVENVVISNCIIRSRTNAIKAGTESYGGFRNITITNCIIRPSVTNDGVSGYNVGTAGIALEIVDGGLMENITISNLIIEETTSPIFIRLGNRAREYPKLGLKSKPIGTINNINISNIIATKAGKTGCSIVGEIGHPIKNVSISNVKINFDGGGSLKEALVEKPELVNEYPECVRLGILPAYGFFVRHVDGITFRDVEFTFNDEEHRPALLFDDVQNIKLLNFDAESTHDALAKVVFRNSQNLFVNGCSPKEANIFLRIEKNSRDIKITGNDLSEINKPLYVDETIRMETLKVASNLTGRPTLFKFLQPNIERDSLGLAHIYYPDNAEIHYTLDSSEPDQNAPKYTKPFEQINLSVIKAVAFKDGVQSSTETLEADRAQVLAPHISAANQFFYKNIELKLISNTKNVDIYYTLDGSEPTKSSEKYKGKLEISHTSKLRTKAFKNGYTSSEETSVNFVLLKEIAGIHYKYYENNSNPQWESLPSFVNLKPAKEGNTDKLSFEGIARREKYFGLVLHQLIKISKTGEYTFYTGSNDGSMLLVDNKVVVNNDGNHGYIEKSGKIHLKKGAHLIEVRYYQAGGGKSLKLFWQGPGFEKRAMTKENLTSK